jgi:hypothetical protein
LPLLSALKLIIDSLVGFKRIGMHLTEHGLFQTLLGISRIMLTVGPSNTLLCPDLNQIEGIWLILKQRLRGARCEVGDGCGV